MEDLTLIDSLKRQLIDRPDELAYRHGEQRLSYRDVEAHTSRLANALAHAGVTRDTRVAVLTKHHIECILVTLAACKLGAVCMPVNWRLTASEVAYIVNNGEAPFLMADAEFMPTVEKAGLPGVKTLVCTGATHGSVPSLAQWYADFPDTFTPVAADTHDAALQLYSSGTTGLPKGIVLSHAGLLSTSRVVAKEWKFDHRHVLGNPLPVFHVAGMTMLLLTLCTGGQTSAYADFDPKAYLKAFAQHGITHTFVVPAMILFMLQVPDAKAHDFGMLQLMAYGGSPVSETVLQQAFDVFGCDFLQVYGLTEVSGPATFLFPEDHRSGDASLLRSAGRPIGGGRLRIVDPISLQDLPDGEVGEIWIESDRNLKEYWRNPQATAAAYPEGRNTNGGWFRSGDGGYLKDGYLFINDRIKDMIVSGGENIYPAEVENVLMRHPAVLDGAVIGVPDATWGEAVKACVVLRPGATASERDIIEFMRENLAHYKCPKSLDIIEALPRNPSGKVLKRVLREPYWKGQARAVG
ncbi:long-chain-fatty-acid--CoA ligase [Variovorax ginsengisoli]|uniref:Long-chain acyl-CoA synthetase n=1 Tax=Variovorax ginsengisoli TaxID=363844 RepID=A0ABT9SAI9_9BURK|nr:long-chain-fatty-acid--CoA ligase [Variovorax ginsengisoli]MDP9900919.1 long-chain acyl-CoA synthetase [Variovorax ginsengisoli]